MICGLASTIAFAIALKSDSSVMLYSFPSAGSTAWTLTVIRNPYHRTDHDGIPIQSKELGPKVHATMRLPQNSSQYNESASSMDEAEKVLGVAFISDDEPSKILEPSDQVHLHHPPDTSAMFFSAGEGTVDGPSCAV